MDNSKWISKYSGLLFVAISFLFSWIFFLPNVLTDYALSTGLLLLARIIGSFGPGIAAVLVLFLTEGKSEVKALFRKTINFSNLGKWLVATIIMAVLVVALPLGLLIYMHGVSLSVITTSNWLMLIPNFIISLLIFGSIADELGWRGFLLPRLQSKMTAFSASLLIGFLWALWQLPTYFFAGITESGLSPLWMFIELISLSIILTWLYNSTQSLGITIIFNAIYRTLTQFFLPVSEVSGHIVDFQHLYSGVLVNIALIILLFCGGKTLVFSYKPRRSQED